MQRHVSVFSVAAEAGFLCQALRPDWCAGVWRTFITLRHVVSFAVVSWTLAFGVTSARFLVACVCYDTVTERLKAPSRPLRHCRTRQCSTVVNLSESPAEVCAGRIAHAEVSEHEWKQIRDTERESEKRRRRGEAKMKL